MKLHTLLGCLQYSVLAIGLSLPGIATAIDLPTAVRKTLENSPRLQRYPFHIRALDGEAIQAGLKPNPTLHVDIENVLGTGGSRFLAGTELTLSLSQLIELGNKREKRINIVDQKSAAIQRDYEVKRLDVVADMMRRFYDALRLQYLIDWNKTRIQSEQSALDVIIRRAQAGVVGQADVMRMQLRLAKSKVKQAELKQQHQQALIVLATHWAASADFEKTEGQLEQVPELPSETMLMSALDQTPDYLLAQAETRINQARLSLAQAESQANITVGGGIRRMEAIDDNAFVFNFSMPLQWHNRNQGNIALAQAQYEEKLANQDILIRQLELTLGRIRSAMNTRLNQIQRLETELQPVASSLLAEIKQGYQLGQYTVLQWVDAQDELFSIERDVIESQYAVHMQFLELERLSGNSLINTAKAPAHKE
ncbi:MAG: TolC family protein [Gammaproteobacteria bacterium]|nr:TolC family protein [Gammaproteobacteria bacterium]